MNFNYKELSKTILEATKTKNKNTDLIEVISDIIRNEVAKIKRADKYKEKIKKQQEDLKENKLILDNPMDILNKLNDESNDESNVELKIDSLEQRIFQEHDDVDTINIFNTVSDINKLNNKFKEHKTEKVEEKINTTNLERFQVRVKINSNLKVKPKFQVFKEPSEDVVGSNGLVESTFHNFLFFIDSIDEATIRKHMTEIFEPGQMSFDISVVPFDYIPVQYKELWRNQTTM